MSTIDLQVQGMTCGACVRHVIQALTPVVGVTDVAVDLGAGRARVEGDADHAALIAALVEAGYPARLDAKATPRTPSGAGCGSRCGCH